MTNFFLIPLTRVYTRKKIIEFLPRRPSEFVRPFKSLACPLRHPSYFRANRIKAGRSRFLEGWKTTITKSPSSAAANRELEPMGFIGPLIDMLDAGVGGDKKRHVNECNISAKKICPNNSSTVL